MIDTSIIFNTRDLIEKNQSLIESKLELLLIDYYLAIGLSNKKFKDNFEKRLDEYLLDFDADNLNLFGITNSFVVLIYLISAYDQEKKYNNVLSQLISYWKSNIKKYVYPLLIEEKITHNHIDIISGISNIGNLLLYIDDDNNFEMIDKITRYLINKLKNYKNAYFFPYSIFDDESNKFLENTYYYDLGLSHGGIGALVFLSRVQKKNNDIYLKNAIIHALDIYYKNSNSIDGILQFPESITYINEIETKRKSERMSWCYGNIGILRALYIIEDNLDRKDKKEKIFESIENLAEIDINKTRLECPTMCHGLSGMSVILKIFLKERTSSKIEKRVIDIEKIISSKFDFKYKFGFEKIDYLPMKRTNIYSEENLSIIDGIGSILIVGCLDKIEPKMDIYSRLISIL